MGLTNGWQQWTDNHIRIDAVGYLHCTSSGIHLNGSRSNVQSSQSENATRFVHLTFLYYTPAKFSALQFSYSYDISMFYSLASFRCCLCLSLFYDCPVTIRHGRLYDKWTIFSNFVLWKISFCWLYYDYRIVLIYCAPFSMNLYKMIKTIAFEHVQ